MTFITLMNFGAYVLFLCSFSKCKFVVAFLTKILCILLRLPFSLVKCHVITCHVMSFYVKWSCLSLR
jgi:hypothetical protein